MKIWWKPKERAYPDPENIAESKIASLQDGITDFDGLHAYNRLRVPIVSTITDTTIVAPVVTAGIGYSMYMTDHITCYGSWASARACPIASSWHTISRFYTGARLAGSDYIIHRIKLAFSPTGLTPTVIKATLSMYLGTIQQEIGGSGGIYVVSGSDTENGGWGEGDFLALSDNQVSFGAIASGSLVVGAYNDIELSSTALGEINAQITAGEFVRFGIRQGDDFDDIAPINNVRESQYEWHGDLVGAGIFNPYLTLWMSNVTTAGTVIIGTYGVK